MPRRVMQGQVVSDKNDKTVVVLIERRLMHPVYKKFIKKSKRYAAHDDTNAFRIGDLVEIEECAPISRRKRWRVITPPPSERDAFGAVTETSAEAEVQELLAETAVETAERAPSAGGTLADQLAGLVGEAPAVDEGAAEEKEEG